MLNFTQYNTCDATGYPILDSLTEVNLEFATAFIAQNIETIKYIIIIFILLFKSSRVTNIYNYNYEDIDEDEEPKHIDHNKDSNKYYTITLPGWYIHRTKRLKGRYDVYYLSPLSGRIYRSKKELEKLFHINKVLSVKESTDKLVLNVQ